MPWYTTADARRDAEKQSASKNRENSVRDNEGPSMNDMEREYRQLCRIDETPGVRGLAQLGRNAIERVAQLEKELAAAVAERDRIEAQRLYACGEVARICAERDTALARLAAIDAAPVVAWQDKSWRQDLYHRRPDPAQVDTRELIAKPAKD